MPARLSALIFFLLLSAVAGAQYFSKEKELIARVNGATTPAQTIKALGDLAEFYYIFRADKKGDSVLQEQLLAAELSNNKDLVLETLFSSAINNIPSWSSTNAFDKALSFLDKGLNYARELNNDEKQALAYIRKAAILRKKGETDNALQKAVLSLTSANNTDNDSLKAAIYLETGDIFLNKRDAVSAYKNYNNAFDLAYKIGQVQLQSETYHHLSSLYQSLADTEMAKSNLLQSLDLNLQANNTQGLMMDYFDLARQTNKKEYIERLLQLASKEKAYKYVFMAKQLMFAYLIVVEQNSKHSLNYLYSNEDLLQSYLNTGIYNFYWNIGNVFRYTNQPDSALRYYSLAAPGLEESFNASVKKAMYKGMAECFENMNQPLKAIEFYEKAMALSEATNSLDDGLAISLKLSNLYAGIGDFRKALELNRKHLSLKDTLQNLAAQKVLVLLNVNRENKKHEKDLADKAAKTLRIQNLQYIGISIVIASFFTFMLLLGMFPVSRLTIKILSFIAFICLFEFIVMLIDNYVHKITHHQPLQIWLIKIFLIAALVPLQHFLEHGLVRFLASQRLLQMRQHLSVKRLWINLIARIKKPAPVTEAGVEEDTAVL